MISVDKEFVKERNLEFFNANKADALYETLIVYGTSEEDDEARGQAYNAFRKHMIENDIPITENVFLGFASYVLATRAQLEEIATQFFYKAFAVNRVYQP